VLGQHIFMGVGGGEQGELCNPLDLKNLRKKMLFS